VSVLKTDHARPDDSAYWQTLLNQAVDMYQLIPSANHFSALSELSVNIVLDFITCHTLTENEAKDAG
jgi:hypothetical protein